MWSAASGTELIHVKFLTLVEVFGRLAGIATAIGATFFPSRAFSVVIAALHAGCCKAAGSLWRWATALLHCQHRLKEFTAGHTLPVFFGKHPLQKITVNIRSQDLEGVGFGNMACFGFHGYLIMSTFLDADFTLLT